MKLSERARATLLDWNIDPDEFARLHGDSSADEWRGDSCGCTDDRCNGHHHAEGKACGCIDVEIDEYWKNIHAGTEGQEVWAAHQLALATGSKKDRAAADKLAADWIEHYHKGSRSYSLTETPRGITTTNRYNDHSWLVFDAATGKATVEQLN